ncbi:MAG TPA: hypothetical protein VMH88_10230 [Gemmatimonadales bacterium]|nr:hypothetical protein [Gemmatimonadales bacterium]
MISSVPVSRQDGARLALILSQLILLLLVIRAFELENRTVFYLLVGAVLGFAVHALLPLRHRLPWFGVLSVASVLAVLGWRDGAIVLGVGFGLIGVSHLRAPLWLRLALIGAIAAGLVVLRVATTVFAGPSAVVVATLGSMFMFRLALYLHSVHHQDAPHGLAWSTAYFFMVPNVCYPLFPVVDYTTFVRTHFDAERFRTYDRGVRFLLRGVLQLLAYRLIVYEVAIDGLYVNNIAELVRFLVSNFLLYVKISGQFWLIIGVLGLFGFRLPETNHLYFLASSPTDFWRRINIYWKDFMMKLVYYPSFFRLRRYGTTLAVGVATLVVFAATWLLHAYQFYWLQNAVSLSKRDIVFWGLFGLLVLPFTLREAWPGRRRTPKTARGWSAARGVATVATFTLIAILWSLWDAKSFGTWKFMLAQARYSTPAQWAGLVALLLLAVGLAGVPWGAPTLEQPSPEAEPLGTLTRRAARRGLLLAGLAALSLPSIRSHLPNRPNQVVAELRDEGRPVLREVVEQTAYYENLTHASNRIAIPWTVPPTLFSRITDFYLPVPGHIEGHMPADTTITFVGTPTSLNRLRMRDRNYSVQKPPDTYRIEVFGPSDIFGWGVRDSEVFNVPLAAMLGAAAPPGTKVEVLNFGIPASNLAQQVLRFREEGLQFSPDLVILTAHPLDLLFWDWVFEKTFAQGYPAPDSGLAGLMASVGLGPGRNGTMADLRLVEEHLDQRVFQWAQELAAPVGAHVAVLQLYLVTPPYDGNLATTRRAAAATHVPVLDCRHLWRGQRLDSLRLSSRDAHMNAIGHRMLAQCLFDELRRQAGALDVRPLLPATR